MDRGGGTAARRGFACTARRQVPRGGSPTLSRQSRQRTRDCRCTPSARRRLPRRSGLPRAAGPGCRRSCGSSRPIRCGGAPAAVPRRSWHRWSWPRSWPTGRLAVAGRSAASPVGHTAQWRPPGYVHERSRCAASRSQPGCTGRGTPLPLSGRSRPAICAFKLWGSPLRTEKCCCRLMTIRKFHVKVILPVSSGGAPGGVPSCGPEG
jgi:hypothetical protein